MCGLHSGLFIMEMQAVAWEPERFCLTYNEALRKGGLFIQQRAIESPQL